MDNHADAPVPDRRAFLKQGGAIMTGGLCGLVPLAAGVRVFCDPLRRQPKAAGFLHVASLQAVPEDGIPRKFTVIAHRHDAWSRFPDVPVGAVYLRRTGSQTIQALQVACPHAGCFVDFHPDRSLFVCPCHNSTFAVDGRINDRNSPAPRPMDGLEVELRNGAEVWVKYQNFLAGRPEKLLA